MTPEEARALLVDLDLESVPPYEKLSTGGNLFEVLDKERNLVANLLAEREAALVVAAPALAELVANMHYEYAVQLKHGDGWITSRHHTPTVEVAEEVAARYERSETRIVRRLVSDVEVVE